MLNNHKWSPVVFIWGQLHNKYLSYQSTKLASKLLILNSFKSLRRHWDKLLIYHLCCTTTMVPRYAIFMKHQTWSGYHLSHAFIIILGSLITSVPGLAERHSNLWRWFNSMGQSDAYMRQWNKSSLVQIKACRLFGIKPLPEPMPTYFQLGPKEQVQWNFDRNSNIFIQGNVREYVVCKIVAILPRPQCVKCRFMY